MRERAGLFGKVRLVLLERPGERAPRRLRLAVAAKTFYKPVMKTIYLDHQASTPLDPRVLEVMIPWLEKPANPHATENLPGRQAHEAVETAREKVAAAFGAQREDIIFTSGATEAANIVLRSLVQSGGRLVVSTIEHPCVAETAEWLANRGAKVDWVRVDELGIVDLEELERALDGGPQLVSIMAVNNEIGTIQPLTEIAALCAQVDALFHTDAAQAAGRIALRAETDFDIATISGHKIYGPQGIGAIITTKAIRKRLRPLVTGGGQEMGLRPGTVPIALCVGFGEAVRIAVEELEFHRAHATALAECFLERLQAAIGEIWINGSTTARIPDNLNISIPGVTAEELLARSPELALSTGSACASGSIEPSRVLAALGTPSGVAEGAVRIGFGRNTTIEDAKRAAELLARAAKQATGLQRSRMGVNA